MKNRSCATVRTRILVNLAVLLVNCLSYLLTGNWV